ncbi:DNA-processing protein DprA [Magnetococcales bacterium HHB-1]
MIDENQRAVLLLTAHFGKNLRHYGRPLTPTEWQRFSAWLHQEKIEVQSLLYGAPDAWLNQWRYDKKITPERLRALLDRGEHLKRACDQWQQAGVWVVTLLDEDYPEKFKIHLKHTAPPLLFGCGSRILLNQRGIAVVGSRKANHDDLQFSFELGEKIAAGGFAVISGGARGVDETVMMGGVHAEGTVVGILAHGLRRASVSASWREAIARKNLLLLSPFDPDAGFMIGQAMARNRYIYCLSELAIVVHSGKKGGTWSGAQDNLKRGFVPLWVKPTEDKAAGNRALVEAGALWMPEDLEPSLLDSLVQEEKKCLEPRALQKKNLFSEPKEEKTPPVLNLSKDLNKVTLYQLFLYQLASLIKTETKSAQEISQHFDIPIGLANRWLKKAVDEDYVERYLRPVRYRMKNAQQLSMTLSD